MTLFELAAAATEPVKGAHTPSICRESGRRLFRPDRQETPQMPAGSIDWEKAAKAGMIHIGGHP